MSFFPPCCSNTFLVVAKSTLVGSYVVGFGIDRNEGTCYLRQQSKSYWIEFFLIECLLCEWTSENNGDLLLGQRNTSVSDVCGGKRATYVKHGQSKCYKVNYWWNGRATWEMYSKMLTCTSLYSNLLILKNFWISKTIGYCWQSYHVLLEVMSSWFIVTI